MNAWEVLVTWLVPAGVGLVQGYRLAHRDQGAVITYLRQHVAVVTAERDEARAFLAWERQVSSMTDQPTPRAPECAIPCRLGTFLHTRCGEASNTSTARWTTP